MSKDGRPTVETVILDLWVTMGTENEEVGDITKNLRGLRYFLDPIKHKMMSVHGVLLYGQFLFGAYIVTRVF